MRAVVLVVVTLFVLLFHSSFAQINTPSTCKYPFGLMAHSGTGAYPYGLMPTTLPTGAYKYLTTSYGKSADAARAYLDWKTNYTEKCSNGSIRVLFDDPTRTVSEGIAYGMLLSVYAADKPLFDGLWSYYKTNSVTNRGIMGWNRTGCANGDAGSGGNGGATDAELDAAMALIIAECQWPDINSPYNYSTEATNLINAVKTYEIHPSTYQTINGDGWGFGSTCRNPSYFSPAYYKEYALQVPADSAYWAVNVTNTTYSFLTTNRNSSTGLVSNWSNNFATPNNCNGPIDYGYDACRNPWRMATDVLWYDDANAKAILSLVNSWLTGYVSTCGGPVALGAANPSLGQFHNAIFVSTWAAGTMGGNSQSLVNQFYTETVRVTDGGYYGSTLRALMLFMLTGNFWKPCPSPSYIELASTNIDEKAGTVYLSFTSNVEFNVSKFKVYVSGDKQNYTLVKEYTGNIESRNPIEYSFSEERYFYPKIYYKITYVDSFGNEQELKTLEMERKEVIQAFFAPNPFYDQLSIYLSSPESEPMTARIADARGRLLAENLLIPTNKLTTLDLFLPSGVYFISIPYQGEKYTFKIQKL